MKVCKSCNTWVSLEFFNKAPRNKDGLHSYCKTCMRNKYSGRDRSAYKRQYDQLNRERLRDYRRKYRRKNKGNLWEDRNREASNAIKRGWAKSNHEKVKVINKKYREENKHRMAEYASRRRFIERRAEPLWLTGKTVCGLHVPWNLQLVPKSLNRSKSNRTWPNMWEAAA